MDTVSQVQLAPATALNEAAKAGLMTQGSATGHVLIHNHVLSIRSRGDARDLGSILCRVSSESDVTFTSGLH